MSSEINPDFKTTECQEFCIRVADGTHDSPKETEVGKRLITSKNVKGGRLELDSAYLISIDDFESINKRSKVDQWDLLLTMIGTVGEICLVTEPNPDFAIKNVGLLKCGDELKAKWVYYFLRSPQGQTLIEERKKGSTQQYVSLTELRKLPISYPEDEQEMRLIVQSLGCIDDRINLLRETNKTLEAIAQALFKSWFVDFDPVRAKMEGRQPDGMDEATAALFPDSFEESELGNLPSGWCIETLGNFCHIHKGCSYKGSGLAEDTGAYMFNLGCFNAPRVFALENIKRYTGEYKERHKVSAGDLIVANTDMTQARDILGRPLIVPKGFQDAFISHHVFRLEFPDNSEKSARNFLFFLFGQSDFRARAVGYATGTTVLALPKEALQGFKLVKPSDPVLAAFNEISNCLLDSIQKNENWVKLLVELRDTLLPRLISGQLRLPKAEAEIEALKARRL